MRAEPSSPYERLSVCGNQPLKNALQETGGGQPAWLRVSASVPPAHDSLCSRWPRCNPSRGHPSPFALPGAGHPRHLLSALQRAAQQRQARLQGTGPACGASAVRWSGASLLHAAASAACPHDCSPESHPSHRSAAPEDVPWLPCLLLTQHLEARRCRQSLHSLRLVRNHNVAGLQGVRRGAEAHSGRRAAAAAGGGGREALASLAAAVPCSAAAVPAPAAVP